MKYFMLILIIFYLPISIFAEEVPAGYVAKWETTLLTEKDYTENANINCESFSRILAKGKIEQPQIIPLKIINNTLINFIKGYQLRDNIKFDSVVVWPNYEQSDWYVLMAYKNCFIRWIEIQPDNIQSIIEDGKVAG